MKLTARIATMLRTAGTCRVDSVGAVATPASPSRSEGSGARSGRAPHALIASVALIACLAFGPSVASAAVDPTITIDPSPTASYNTAQVSGTYDVHGRSTPAHWDFEYTTDPLLEGWIAGGVEGGTALGLQHVSSELHNLKPGHQYQIRLRVQDTSFETEGTWYSPEPNPTFTTLPVTDPTLDPGSASEVAYTTAHLEGSLNPHESPIPIAYHFEYSTDPATEGWLSGGFGEFSAAETGGTTPLTVEADLQELRAGAQYQYRLVGSNGNQSVSSEPNPTFTTEAVTAPSVTLEPVTTFTDTTAHFSGTVDPNAPAGPLSPADEAAYKADWHFECSPECPGLSGASVEADEGSQTVSADSSGLEPNTSYEARLVVTNGGGSVSDVQNFSTTLIPATVRNGPGASDGEGGYILEGVVNPHNSAVTACEFEYGLSTGYDESIPCDSNPGAVNKPVLFNAHPTGLILEATYHFRFTLTTGAGPVSSADGVFIPSLRATGNCTNEVQREENNSLALPECRAYEQVSSTFKNGFAAFGPFAYTEDGLTFKYASPGIFGGVGLGTPVNSYFATRTGDGWSSSSHNPSGPAYEGGAVADNSADLQSTLFIMRRGDDSNAVADWYLRGPDGSISLIGPGANHALIPGSPPGPNNGGAPPEFAGASSDLSHVVFFGFQSALFPGDVSRSPVLYEYVGTGNDRPRRVAVDNAGSPLTECEQLLGGRDSKNNAVSTSGRTIFFTVFGGCGGIEPPAGEVWARVDGTTSYDASESHCARTSAEPGGLCNGPSNARYQGALADGSRVYFTTSQQLVNGDTDETEDLYEYDLPTAPNPNPSPALTEVSGGTTGADVEGVARISDDGSRVYFVARGVLAANLGANNAPAHAGDNNLYVWERDASHPAGEMTFVGALASNDGELWGSDYSRLIQTTPNGRYMVLSTFGQLVGTDTDNARDMYRYDAETGEIVRLSTDISGTGGNTDGLDTTFEGPRFIPTGPADKRQRTTMTNDGATVIFLTSEALSPADVNGVPDVYLWHGGHVSLITTGRWVEEASTLSIDGSGDDIYFRTAEALTPSDADTTVDFYDARINGGFSARKAVPCSGESCQPAQTGLAASLTPRTDRPNGSGNLKPQAKHCVKGKVVRKGHCVKKKHKKAHKRHHHKSSKKANAKRGGAK